MTFDEMPLLQDPSPRLLEDSQMILSDFSQEDFTFPASLPPVAQVQSPHGFSPHDQGAANATHVTWPTSRLAE